MGDKSLRLEIETAMRPAMRIAGGGNVYGAGGVVAAECDYGILSSAFACALDASAAASKAWCSVVGSSLPLRSARRRMPLQAFALKKYRGGTGPVSKMSDNEETPASLRDGAWKAVCSDKLSIQNSPPDVAIPAFDQAPEDGTKIPSAV
jgi:hypothetical protein